MNKICTSLEQSKKLVELGIDVSTADMYWKNGISDKYIQCFTPFVCDEYQSEIDFDYDIPCWSLAALLDILPEPYQLTSNKEGKVQLMIIHHLEKEYYDNPIDACVEMIVKLKEQNLI